MVLFVPELVDLTKDEFQKLVTMQNDPRRERFDMFDRVWDIPKTLSESYWDYIDSALARVPSGVPVRTYILNVSEAALVAFMGGDANAGIQQWRIFYELWQRNVAAGLDGRAEELFWHVAVNAFRNTQTYRDSMGVYTEAFQYCTGEDSGVDEWGVAR